MFAKVEVLLPEEKTVLVTPVTAVLSQPYGDLVYVIEPAPETIGQKLDWSCASKLSNRQARGDLITITGLKPGDRVVSAGGLKLRNGMSVTENNDLVPKSEKSPRPPGSIDEFLY